MAFGTGTVLTNAGKAITTNRIKGAGAEPNYIAVGTGATAGGRNASTADYAALALEKTTTRLAGTSTQQMTTVSNDTYQVVGTVTCSGTAWAVDEAGLLDAATAGNMYLYATFPVVNLAVGDSIQTTLKVQYS